MGKKIVLAGLLGGVLVFIVSGIVHSTKLGEVGIRAMPNENLVLNEMHNSLHEPGFYIFPAPNLTPMSKEQKQEEEARYLAKFKQGPTGVLMYKPGGEDLNFGKLLAVQFVIGLVAAFIAAWILGVTARATSFGTRVAIVVLIGIFAEIYINFPYWNWYGFPMNYTIGHLVGGVVAWFGAGLGMAAVTKPPVTP